MAEQWLLGHLDDRASAPESGEHVARLLELPGVVVEQILSGSLEAPIDYRQEDDEWVVLLAGHAVLVVGGDDVELNAGDWLFLPAGVEHRLVATAPGSSWLAVHVAR